jgi:hypothetical protein
VNWHNYNQSLVRRGEVLLCFDVIDNWDNELEKMNKDKVGEPFHYPNSFLLLLGYAKVYFHLPYRQTEGVVRAHAEDKIPSIPDYSTISRRINKLDIQVNNHHHLGGDNIVIAIDSTGIKVTNRGDWIRYKWNINKRGYLKIHVAVDIKKKRILSLHVASEEVVHDGKVLPELIHNVMIKNNKEVKTVLADGLYDSNKNFRYLSFNGIIPGIKVRKNSKCRKTSHYLRNISVLMQKKDFDKWKDNVSYGQRWIVESVFSCIKRMFGEYVSAIKFPNIVKEFMLKTSLYNWFTSLT